MIEPGVFERSFIGRIMVIPKDAEFPDDWRECDGSRIADFQYPRFFAAMGATGDVLALPKQEQVDPEYRAIIKLGPRVTSSV